MFSKTIIVKNQKQFDKIKEVKKDQKQRYKNFLRGRKNSDVRIFRSL